MSRRLLVWAFLDAVRDFVADGCNTVSREEYRERLTICQNCPSGARDFLQCSAAKGGCGCLIHVKAIGRAWDCPNCHWPTFSESTPQDRDSLASAER